MLKKFLILGILLTGCETSNTYYYYVCFAPEVNYKRGYFSGIITYNGKETVFVDTQQKQYSVPGVCFYLDFAECERYARQGSRNCP